MFALRVRSYFSLMEGTASPLALCKQVKKLGYSHLSLTDRDNLYGLPAFIDACRRTGLQPIIGSEISDPEDRLSPLCCLVINPEGYSHLSTLLTHRKCQPDFSLQEIPKKYSRGLIFLSDETELLERYAAFGFYTVADLGQRPTAKSRHLKNWAHERNIPVTTSLNSSLLKEDDAPLYTLLQAIEKGCALTSVEASQPGSLLSWEQLQSHFSIWPEAMAATLQLGEKCAFRGPNFGMVMPPWQDKSGKTAAVALRQQAYLGAQLRYGRDLSKAHVQRLEYELKIINEMGFSSYFLIVRDIVHPQDADGLRRKRRICGRGSGAASLVAYCLEITNVCPVKHNLYFERFLNPGRQDPPDIDIDFAWDERDFVLEEVLAKFAGHVALVSNHVYFQPRMAIRETAKTFGLPPGEISGLTRKLHLHSHSSQSLEEKISHSVACKDQNIDQLWSTILQLAEKLVGMPRHLSVHPGGVIITPKRIETYVPVEMAPKGVPIIQWEKDGAEDSGLIKIDILGNRSLGVIRDAIINMNKNGLVHDEAQWVAEDDSPTQKSVALGLTMGCFYIESPAMRLLQQKAGTGDFEQLIIQSSIIRPAANDFVREYVRRLHGGSWEHLHPKLADVLDDTFGLMVYQEDVSKVAVALAGFSHARADGLRKVLSKKDRELRLKDYKKEFYTGCLHHNIEHDTIDKLWAMILSFDGYSFCKPHSASYAKVSFQAAYLKRYYPAEFMAAVISNQGGFYSTFAYISEAKRLGLTILEPDVNNSEHMWHGQKSHLQVGFLAIKGLSERTIQKILLERGKIPFQNCSDFFYRVSPSEDEGRALIHSGALDRIGGGAKREELLWNFATFKKINHQGSALSLFPPCLPPAPQLKSISVRERLRYQYRYLGFLCHHHPITLVTKGRGSMVKAQHLSQYIGKKVAVAGWLLTGKIVSTKTGEAMEFLTFEDETASFETTFFPRVYRRHAHILDSGYGYLLHGVVDEDFGAISLTVQMVSKL